MQQYFRFMLAALTVLCTMTAFTQWQPVNTGFNTPRWRILSIAVVNSSTVWAVADSVSSSLYSHRILRTTNAGATWNISAVPTFIAEYAFDVSAIDANTAWVTTNPLQFGDSTGGGVYKTTDGGATWEKQLSIKSVWVYFFDSSSGVMVNTTRVFTTSNGGTNWVRTTSVPPYDVDEFNIVSSLNNTRAAAGDTIWVCTSRGRVFRSTNRGRDWTASVTSFGRGFEVTTLAFRDARNGLAVSSHDSNGTLSSTKVSRTTDGGIGWQTMTPPSGFTVQCIAAVPGTNGTYVIVGSVYGGTSGSAYTTNNGEAWNVIDSGIRYNAVEFISPTVGWVGGISIAPTELMYKWTGSLLVPPTQGQWLEQTSGFPDSGKTILSMNAVNQNIVWGLGGDFELNPYQRFTRTTNGGTSWTSGVVTETTGLVGSCISAIDANTAWAAMGDLSFATSGGIYKTTDAGATWSRQTTAYPSAGGFVDIVHMFDLNSGVAIGDPNGGYYEIYTTANGGVNWNRVPSANIPAPLNGEFGLIPGPVFFALNNTVWFGTSQGRIYRSTNRGTNWTAASLGLDTTHFVYSIAFRDNSNGLATTISSTGVNRLLRTNDGGTTWSSLTLPPRPVASWVTPVPGTSLYVLTSDFVYRGVRQGSAYSSNDGVSWTLIDTLEHGTTTFIAPNTGWSGKRTGSGGQGGMWKYNGSVLVTSISISSAGDIPNNFRLEQNYPNPFNPTTEIRFAVAENGRATLEVFNILGQKVATLFDEVAEAGRYYDVKFNAAQLASGVYLYKLQSGTRSEVKKLMLLR